MLRARALPLSLLLALGGCEDVPKDDVTVDDTDAPSPDETDVVLQTPVVRFEDPAPDTTADLVVVIDNAAPGATYTYTWAQRPPNGTEAPRLDLKDQASVPASQTTRGDVWRVVVIGTRDGQVTSPGEATVTVVNAPPEVSFTITPGAPVTGQGLGIQATTSDPDGDEVELLVSWFENDDPRTTGPTVSGVFVEKGQTWRARVVPTDGMDEGEAVEASVDVGNSPPLITDLVLAPLTPPPNTFTELRATWRVTDPDLADTVHQTEVRWLVNGAVVPGATGNRLDGGGPTGPFVAGDVVGFEVRAFDGDAWTDPWAASPTVTIANSVPMLAGIELEPAEAREDTVLTCRGVGFTDADDHPEGFRYGWHVDGRALSGVTTPTLTGEHFDRGDVVTCQAAAWDGFDASAPPLISQGVTILNSPPVVANPRLNNLRPHLGDPISVTTDPPFDADGDPVGLRYQWLRNNQVIPGQTTHELTGGYQVNDVLDVRITPFDGFEDGATVQLPIISRAQVMNRTPVVELLTVEPDPVRSGIPVQAKAIVTDADGDPVTVTYKFFVGSTRLPDQPDLEGDGEVLDPSHFAKGDRITINAWGHDGRAMGQTASILRVVGDSPPAITAVTITPEGPRKGTSLTCEPSGWSDPDGDPPAYRFAWEVDGAPAGGDSATLGGALVQKGQTVTCTATPYSLADNASPGAGRTYGTPLASAPVVIGNTPPVLESASLNTTSPQAGASLEALPGPASDVDGDPITFRYAWFVNGQQLVGSTQPVLPSDRFGASDQVYAVVTPYDGTALGAPVQTDVAVGQNSPPVIVSVELQPSPARASDDIVAVVDTSDPDDDPVVTTFTWYIDDVVVAGVTGDTLEASHLSPYQYVRVDVLAEDGRGGTDTAASEPVFIRNTVPTIEGVALVPEEVYEETVVTCTPHGWHDPDGDPPGYVYAWRRNGILLNGQSGATLTGEHFNKADAIRCEVRPYDGDPLGPGPWVLGPTLVVRNTPPVLLEASLDNPTPTERSPVGVVLGDHADVDGDPVSFRYRWFVDGVEAVGFDQPSLDGLAYDRGQSVYALVTPTDGEDDGAPVPTDPVTVGNAPPEIVSVLLMPAAADITDTIEAVVDATDPDGDPVTTSIDWYVDDQLMLEDSPTLDPIHFAFGSTIRAVAVAEDTLGAVSDPVASLSIQVGNAAPSITDVYIEPGVVRKGTPPECVPDGWFDPDGDPPGYVYAWYRNGSSVAVSATRVLSNNLYQKGDTLVCGVRPYDGASLGDEVKSDPVPVENTPPTAAAVALTPTSPREGDHVSVVFTQLADADGDALTRTYAWYVDDVLVDHDGPTLSGAFFDKGQAIRAHITVSDGEADVPFETAPVTAVNTPPVVTGLTIAPQGPRVDEDVTVTATWSDPDPADTLEVTWTWLVDGEPVEGVDGDVLPAGSFRKHQVIVARLTVGDGTADTVRDSAPTTAVNSPPVIGAVVITPDPVTRAAPARCVAEDVHDADGDTVQLAYRWLIEEQNSQSTASLPPSLFRRGDRLRCIVTPIDDEVSGVTVSSDEAIVRNAPPQVDRLELTPQEPREVDLIEARLELSDPDGDLVTWTYAWFVNDVFATATSTIVGGGGPNAGPETFDRGDRIKLRVVANDGFADSAEAWSEEIVAVNTRPDADRVRLSPTEPRTNDVVVALPEGVDADGDTITWAFQWLVDGVEVPGVTGDALPPEASVKHQRLQVIATPHDGIAAGDPVVSAERLVLNSAPTAPVVEVTPELAEPGLDDITCSVVEPAYDADGDPLTYEFTWRTSSVSNPPPPIASTPTSSTMSRHHIGAGEVWVCTARANDGEVFGPLSAGASNEIRIFRNRSCNDLYTEGYTTNGVYELDPDGRAGPAAPYEAWCDQTTEGGGWTRVVRTTGQSADFGQTTTSIVTSFAAADASQGVYDAFRHLTGWNDVLIKQVSGAQAGRYKAFRTHGTVYDSLRDVLEHCRTEVAQPNDDGAFVGSRVLGHTSVYSATSLAGDLQVYRNGGTYSDVSYFFACGVNNSDNNDVSYLAFTDQRGDQNDWGDAWRGTGQIGTIWSFANGDYCCAGSPHIGSPGLEALAGWKGTPGTPSGTNHQGTYELYVR